MLKQYGNKVIAMVLSIAMMFSTSIIKEIKNVKAATGDVAINSTNFPDSVFRSYVSNTFDTNNNGRLSSYEIENATEIHFRQYYVTDKIPQNLDGIKYLSNLEEIYIEGGNVESNSLKNIDVSGMTYLNSIYCVGVGLENINVRRCLKLDYINVNDNKLTSLDLSTNDLITILYCENNSLTNITMSRVGEGVFDTRMTGQKINITKLPIENFSIDLNQYAGFDYTKCTIGKQYLDGATYSKGKIIWKDPSDIPDKIVYTYKIDYYDEYGYKDSKDMEVTINLKSETIYMDECDITLSQENFEYNGGPCKPSVTVKYKDMTLKEGTSYNLQYVNNINVGTASVIIKGINGVYGQITKNYTIVGNYIQDCNISINGTSYIYTGNEIRPEIKVYYKNKLIKQNSDYELIYQNNIDAGEATIVIRGTGKFSGKVERTFTISPKNINDGITWYLQKDSVPYTGNECSAKIRNNQGLLEGTDYTVVYTNNVNVGTAQAKILGRGNYSGTVVKEFQIVQSPIDLCTIVINGMEYTPGEIHPEVAIYNGSNTLIEGRDYTLKYSNDNGIGTGKITIEGIGNYSGTIEKMYNILKKNINNCRITVSQKTYKYDGTEKKPDITIYNGVTELVQGVDYNVVYKNNVEQGEATVEIEGTGEYYTGKCEEKYQIVKELKEDDIALDILEKEYTGEEWNVKPIVKDGEKLLVENQDYILEYSDNVNVGIATIYIKGINTYCGVITKNFTISPIDISKLTYRLTYKGEEGTTFEQKYKDEEVKPTVEAFLPNNEKISLEDNFKISYKDANKSGTVKIVLEGKNKVTGIIEVEYVILAKYLTDQPPQTAKSPQSNQPPQRATLDGTKNSGTILVKPGKAKIKKISVLKKRKIKISIKKSKWASGYCIKYSTNVNFKGAKTKNVKTTTCTIGKLKQNKKYYFKVRAYNKKNGKISWGKWSIIKIRKV